MKIAIPTRGGKVDDHFGHCESYTIFAVEENKILSKESFPSPQGCGCKSNIASELSGKGVSVMLAGNMGDGALNVLTSNGIKVYRGCSGDVESVVSSFLEGKISDSGVACKSHGDSGHVCSHGGFKLAE